MTRVDSSLRWRYVRNHHGLVKATQGDENGACPMLQRRLGSTALGLDTGPVSSTGQAFRRYDDVGVAGRCFHEE